MSTKRFDAGDRNGERHSFAVGDWFRWAYPMGIGGVTVVGQFVDVDFFGLERESVASAILRVEPHQGLRDIFRGSDVSQQPGLSGDGGTLRVNGYDLLREIFADRFVKLPMATGANVRIGDNGTLLTFTDANGFACAVVLGPGLPEELARQLAHTTAYPWQNRTLLTVHCPRHPTRKILSGATCDECHIECHTEVGPGIPVSSDIRAGTRVKVTRHKERDDGYSAVARAVRESHEGQIGTAEDYPPMTCVWLVRFADGERVGYNVDELTTVSAQNPE